MIRRNNFKPPLGSAPRTSALPRPRNSYYATEAYFCESNAARF